MRGKVINDNYARLDGAARQARRIYFEAWMQWGFTILLLHKVTKSGECCCSIRSKSRKKGRAAYQAAIAAGQVPPCTNPGKHQIDTAPRSVAKSVDEIEAHLDDGGSVGLVLRVEGAPNPPANLLVWDCDKAGAEEWLHKRLPTSPLTSRGRVGVHDYHAIPNTVPLLRSNTTTLNPGRINPGTEERPGIDIKVSGIVVMAFSRNKTLYIDGVDASANPAAVSRMFSGSLDDFLGKLPQTDPRTLVPNMTEVNPPLPNTLAAPATSSTTKSAGKRHQLFTLSTHRPPKQTLTGDLHNVAYHHRKRLAGRFLLNAKAATEGQNPDATMFRVVATLLTHYGMSEQDAFNLIRKWYNPRCRDAHGNHYPYGDRQIIRMIKDAGRAGIYNPIGLQNEDDFQFDRTEMMENHRRRDQRANDKRKQERATQRDYEEWCIREFIGNRCDQGMGCLHQALQRDLFDTCIAWVWDHFRVHLTDTRIGMTLNNLGIDCKRKGHNRVPYRMGISLLPDVGKQSA